MKKPIAKCLLFLVVAATGLISCSKVEDTTPTGNDRDRFLGSWSVHEIHTKSDYLVTIKADPNEASRVLITNFGNLIASYSATAYISGNNITLDANQMVGNMEILSGSGVLSGTTTINWVYSMTDGATQIDATAVYTKK